MTKLNSQNPADQAEGKLIQLICTGVHPVDGNLPSERILCGQLGITRPTLREVLQRMEQAGWLEIHHGKPTRVKDYLVEGGLTLLGRAAKHTNITSQVTGPLMELRQLLAPVYTRTAVEHKPEDVQLLVQSLSDDADEPQAEALADWRFHYGLGVLSGNPLYALLIHELEGFWQVALHPVFKGAELRQKSRATRRMIGKAARAGEPDAAEALMRRLVQDIQTAWLSTNQ
jgi:GntR family negative regulator for fad regulon and positive regulator of fabA